MERTTMKTAILTLLGLCLTPATTVAAVSDPVPSDVTPRAFALVWVADGSVLGADATIYSDVDGTTELTDLPPRRLVSADFPPALDLGIVKLQFNGLTADTCYYVQTRTTTAGGEQLSPQAPPFTQVCTGTRLTRRRPDGSPMTNDLLRIDATAPDGVSPAVGALVLVDSPGSSRHPISAFVEAGGVAGEARVNLNNLFAPSTGSNTELPDDAVLRVTELRGLHCPALEDQLLLRYAIAPDHEEVASIGVPLSELENPRSCPASDTLCDGVVDVLDAQRVLNAHGAVTGQCAYNPNLDLTADGTIDDQDARTLLDGIVAP
jgi:hypothetical protein